jgi:hypothetical protein
MPFPLLAVAAGAASAALSAISASNQIENASKAEKRAAENTARSAIRQSKFSARDTLRQTRVQAKSYLTQAAIHERQAQLVRMQGSYDAARMTESAKRVVGGQIAAFSSSGIAVTGTIADVVRSSGESAALDIAAARLSTRISWQNEKILEGINRQNAKDILKYGKEAAADTLKYGRQAAKDARKYGAAGAAAAKSATPIAIAAPVIAQIGSFASSGVFSRG